ncbi:snRNA-activating protein complex subunit 3 isoform X2 [Microcaecilia unicolor]|uniref:snRNA-activating protein complex subunit 3 n=1 Tax=Microcaecilia unicolor TaxID=1415580 RepID=A0A6P7X9M7_9AMPH|nr:snRNA-activating protein complex subunit 3 isoform X2 [Microcaecilia unicolor]
MAEVGSSARRSEDDRDEVPEYEVKEQNSKVLHVEAVGRLWRARLSARDFSLQENEEPESDLAAVAQDLGCTLDTAAELKQVCSTDSLKCYEDDSNADPDTIPEDTRLVTLGVRRKILEGREETLTIHRTCRQETFTYELESHALGKKPQNQSDLVEEGELVLTVNIFYPVIFQKHKEHKPYQTLLVLGSQRLTELRDRITCVSDLQIGGEFSATPDLAPEHISKDLYKSAFFYLESTFYNDMRYPECRDLSRTIIEWSESHDRGYGKFQKAKMEDYIFNDLHIKIGFPYLYCHQGDCEHIVMVTDIRQQNMKNLQSCENFYKVLLCTFLNQFWKLHPFKLQQDPNEGNATPESWLRGVLC